MTNAGPQTSKTKNESDRARFAHRVSMVVGVLLLIVFTALSLTSTLTHTLGTVFFVLLLGGGLAFMGTTMWVMIAKNSDSENQNEN